MKILPLLGSAMSGSFRGITASHNKGGLYLRGRTIPTNPNTARQQIIRSVVGGLMDSWNMVLSESQRQGWRDYAAAVPVTDTLGQTMNLSGVNWFVKVLSLANQMRASGLAALTNLPIETDPAPSLFNTGATVSEVTIFEADFTTPPGQLNIQGNLVNENDAAGQLAIFIGAPVTPGTRFYKGPYQLAHATPLALNAGAFNADIDLSMADEWVSDTVPNATWADRYVPLRLVPIYEDGRRAQEWRMLVQFTDATP